jgi:Glycosyltransferase
VKVIAILHCYPPQHNAGAEWALHTFFRAVVNRGHSVNVCLTAQPGEEYMLDGVKVHPFRHKSDPSVYAQQGDVLVTHLENTPRTTALGRILQKPVVHVLHNTFEPSKKWITPDLGLAVFNSEWMKADYEKWWTRHDHPKVPSVVVNPPVIAEDYATISGERLTLINMTEPKGADTFWALAQRMPDVKFLGVIGGYGEQMILKNPPPNVLIQDHTPGHDMKKVYGQTKVLLMPSSYESWGRVGVEAMASGIPVIAHPTPGLTESLGSAGIFVDRDNIAIWEYRIRELLDGRKYRKFSREAKTRSKELDPKPQLDKFVGALEVLHASHARSNRRTSR